MPVLGENGPIVVPAGEPWVGADGTLSVDGVDVARLQLITFGAEPEIAPAGNNRFTITGQGAPSETAGVSQGFLEQSNVDMNQVMVDMLAANRSYAVAQRMMQMADQTLGLAVNDLGKVA
jgi:flagellar basal body rod protein FlgG